MPRQLYARLCYAFTGGHSRICILWLWSVADKNTGYFDLFGAYEFGYYLCSLEQRTQNSAGYYGRFLIYLQPVSGAIISYVLFEEKLNSLGLLGTGLIFVALILILSRKQKKIPELKSLEPEFVVVNR